MEPKGSTDKQQQQQPTSGFASASVATTAVSLHRKRTRDLPDIYNCHGCKSHVSNVGQDKLRTLVSEWRIVLLCRKCLARVGSAQICSYCFSDTAVKSECFCCPQCSRLVHNDCVLQCKDFAPWSYCYWSGSGFSLCVDCWVPPLLLSHSRRASGRNSSLVGKNSNSRASENGDGGTLELGDGVEDDNCVAVLARASIMTTTNINGNSKQSISRVSEDGDGGVICLGDVGKDENCEVYSRRATIRNTTEISGNSKESIFRASKNGDGDGTVGLDDVVKDANSAANKKIVDASRARHKALRKAVVARRAVELAANALGWVAGKERTGGGCTSALDDAELAFRLHRAMNSSPRISRNVCSVDSSCSTVPAMPGCNSSTILAELSKADRMVDARILTTDNECHGCEDDRKKLPRKKGEESCSNNLVTALSGEAYSCEKDDVVKDEFCQAEDSVALKGEICSSPDPYLNKYSRRRRNLKSVSLHPTKLIDDGCDVSREIKDYSCEKDDVFRDELCRDEYSVALKDDICSSADRPLRKYSRRLKSLKSVSLHPTKFIYDGCRDRRETEAYSCEKDDMIRDELCGGEDSVALKGEICSSPDWHLKKCSRRHQTLKSDSPHPAKLIDDGCDVSRETTNYSCEKDDVLRDELCRGEYSVASKDDICSFPDRHLKKYSRRHRSLKSVLPLPTKSIFDAFGDSMETEAYSCEKDDVFKNELCQDEGSVALKDGICSSSDLYLRKYSRRR